MRANRWSGGAGLRDRVLGDWLLESVVVGYHECLYGLVG